jgi:hypothetical protein
LAAHQRTIVPMSASLKSARRRARWIAVRIASPSVISSM